MHTVFKRRRRWPYWAALAAASALVVAVATVGSGFAAAKAKPINTSPPRAIGAARVGQVLTGDRGEWKPNPTKYEDAWLRCAANGGSCDVIAGANGTQYQLSAADEGHTIKFRVTATNQAGH